MCRATTIFENIMNFLKFKKIPFSDEPRRIESAFRCFLGQRKQLQSAPFIPPYELKLLLLRP
jgi:hypothetical protein